jgi:hypothetical protein
MRKPDWVESDKGHGRVERREVWVVGAGELGPYLERELRWPGVRQVGWIRRYRRPSHEVAWQQKGVSTWVSSLDQAKAGPRAIAQGLRGHWAIENGVHWVRDVSMDEDRLHARKIGLVLAAVRNTAINLIRGMGYAFIPDGRREISAWPQHGVAVLTRLSER